MVRDKSQD